MITQYQTHVVVCSLVVHVVVGRILLIDGCAYLQIMLIDAG